MQEYQVFALKGDANRMDAVVASLAEGVGRFGWSYVQGCDLHVLKARVDQSGWESLNEEEQDATKPSCLIWRQVTGSFT